METDVEQPCTTLVVYKTTRSRMKRHQGRGVSVDRFINDLMDVAFPQEIKTLNKRNDKNRSE